MDEYGFIKGKLVGSKIACVDFIHIKNSTDTYTISMAFFLRLSFHRLSNLLTHTVIACESLQGTSLKRGNDLEVLQRLE